MRLVVVVIGFLPILFPQWIEIENKVAILVIAVAILAIESLGELGEAYLIKRKEDISLIVKIRSLIRLFLLALFLHFFGRINGPFFVFFLPVAIEPFLRKDISLANAIVGLMILFTTVEFGWLVFQKEALGFMPIIEFLVRVLVLILMRAYGSILAQERMFEEKTQLEVQETAEKLGRATRELKKANFKLQELSVLKDEFVSVASHELRAPMTTIKGYIAMILDGDAGKIPPQVREFLQDAYEGNERMIRLVNNMLNVSRIESGRLVINLKDIQIEKAIEDVVKDFQLEAESHGLELKYFKPRKKLPKVRVDPDRIKEVISNLVGNGINFTPHGHIYVKSYEEDGMVTIKVEDTGVGIAPEDQKELFKKFSQLETAAPFKKGSGLGLYICRMLVNEFGGDIWLKSKVGRGTTFYFSLPAIINHSQRKEK